MLRAAQHSCVDVLLLSPHPEDWEALYAVLAPVSGACLTAPSTPHDIDNDAVLTLASSPRPLPEETDELELDTECAKRTLASLAQRETHAPCSAAQLRYVEALAACCEQQPQKHGAVAACTEVVCIAIAEAFVSLLERLQCAVERSVLACSRRGGCATLWLSRCQLMRLELRELASRAHCDAGEWSTSPWPDCEPPLAMCGGDEYAAPFDDDDDTTATTLLGLDDADADQHAAARLPVYDRVCDALEDTTERTRAVIACLDLCGYVNTGRENVEAPLVRVNAACTPAYDAGVFRALARSESGAEDLMLQRVARMSAPPVVAAAAAAAASQVGYAAEAPLQLCLTTEAPAFVETRENIVDEQPQPLRRDGKVYSKRRSPTPRRETQRRFFAWRSRRKASEALGMLREMQERAQFAATRALQQTLQQRQDPFFWVALARRYWSLAVARCSEPERFSGDERWFRAFMALVCDDDSQPSPALHDDDDDDDGELEDAEDNPYMRYYVQDEAWSRAAGMASLLPQQSGGAMLVDDGGDDDSDSSDDDNNNDDDDDDDTASINGGSIGSVCSSAASSPCNIPRESKAALRPADVMAAAAEVAAAHASDVTEHVAPLDVALLETAADGFRWLMLSTHDDDKHAGALCALDSLRLLTPEAVVAAAAESAAVRTYARRVRTQQPTAWCVKRVETRSVEEQLAALWAAGDAAQWLRVWQFVTPTSTTPEEALLQADTAVPYCDEDFVCVRMLDGERAPLLLFVAAMSKIATAEPAIEDVNREALFALDQTKKAADDEAVRVHAHPWNAFLFLAPARRCEGYMVLDDEWLLVSRHLFRVLNDVAWLAHPIASTTASTPAAPADAPRAGGGGGGAVLPLAPLLASAYLRRPVRLNRMRLAEHIRLRAVMLAVARRLTCNTAVHSGVLAADDPLMMGHYRALDGVLARWQTVKERCDAIEHALHVHTRRPPTQLPAGCRHARPQSSRWMTSQSSSGARTTAPKSARAERTLFTMLAAFLCARSDDVRIDRAAMLWLDSLRACAVCGTRVELRYNGGLLRALRHHAGECRGCQHARLLVSKHIELFCYADVHNAVYDHAGARHDEPLPLDIARVRLAAAAKRTPGAAELCRCLDSFWREQCDDNATCYGHACTVQGRCDRDAMPVVALFALCADAARAADGCCDAQLRNVALGVHLHDCALQSGACWSNTDAERCRAHIVEHIQRRASANEHNRTLPIDVRQHDARALVDVLQALEVAADWHSESLGAYAARLDPALAGAITDGYGGSVAIAVTRSAGGSRTVDGYMDAKLGRLEFDGEAFPVIAVGSGFDAPDDATAAGAQDSLVYGNAMLRFIRWLHNHRDGDAHRVQRLLACASSCRRSATAAWLRQRVLDGTLQRAYREDDAGDPMPRMLSRHEAKLMLKDGYTKAFFARNERGYTPMYEAIATVAASAEAATGAQRVRAGDALLLANAARRVARTALRRQRHHQQQQHATNLAAAPYG